MASRYEPYKGENSTPHSIMGKQVIATLTRGAEKTTKNFGQLQEVLQLWEKEKTYTKVDVLFFDGSLPMGLAR